MKKLAVLTILACLAIGTTTQGQCTTIDFEDIPTGTSVVGTYAISPLLSISGLNMEVVEEGLPAGSTRAYNSNSGPNWLSGANAKSFGNDVFDDQSDTCEDLTITFNPSIVVSSFEIEMFDYGDWFPLGGSDPRVATLTAHSSDDTVLDTYTLSIDYAPNLHDATGTEGTKTLAVADSDIAYVKLTFEDVDPGVSFDNISICHAPRCEVDLCAGQSDPIGTVRVWDDCDYIYVEFVTEETLLETHVHVGLNPLLADSDFPLTKKGNPIPGQFASAKYYPDEHIHQIDIDGDWRGQTVMIGAHAALGEEETMWVYSDKGDNFMAWTGPGTTAYSCDADERSGTAVPAWEHPAWGVVTSQFTHGGIWIWEAYRSVSPICGDIVDFSETFTIPGLPKEGTLWVTADNGYEAFLNSDSVATDGVFGDWRNSDLTEDYVTTKDTPVGWKSVETAGLIGSLLSGENTFRFETGNEYFYPGDYNNNSSGTVDSNPGGLIYEAEIIYWADGETAWGDGCEGISFPGKNWATYFNYTVQECAP